MGVKSSRPPILSNVVRRKDLTTKTTVNLLGWSEELQRPANTGWAKTNCTINSDVVIAPDNLQTGDKIVIDSGSTRARVSHIAFTNVPVNTPYTFSVYLSPGECTYAALRIQAISALSNNIEETSLEDESDFKRIGDVTAIFDLSAGILVSTLQSISSTFLNYTVEPADNNWLRVSVTGIPYNSTLVGSASSNLFAVITPLTGDTKTPSTAGPVGNGIKGLYAWGGQLERSSEINTYLKTEDSVPSRSSFSFSTDASNFIPFSETFTNTDIWKRTNIASVSTINNIFAPFNLLSSTKISENTSLGQHFIYYNNVVADRRDDYTISVFAKAAERTRLRLSYDNELNTIEPAVFNLVDGEVITSGSFALADIIPYGDGWYRCYVTLRYATVNSSNKPTNLITIGPTDNNQGLPYTGASNSGIYIWGAQVVKRSQPGDYVFTAGAAFTNSKHYDYINVENAEPTPLRPYNLNYLYQSEFFDLTPWNKQANTSIIRYGEFPLIPAGETLQPTFPEDDVLNNAPANVFKLIEEANSSPGFLPTSIEQTVILSQEDISFDGSWTFSMYVREPIEANPANRLQINLDGISCTGKTLGHTSATYSVNPATTSILVQPTTEGFVENVKATINTVPAPSLFWNASKWCRVTLTGTFGIPREHMFDFQGNILSTFSGDDIINFESLINNSLDWAPIRRIRVTVTSLPTLYPSVSVSNAGVTDANGIYEVQFIQNNRPQFFNGQDSYIGWSGLEWAIGVNRPEGGEDLYFDGLSENVNYPWLVQTWINNGDLETLPLPTVTLIPKGLDIWGAQLEQGPVASPYTKSTTNRGYSNTAEITPTKPDERYYFPIIAWGRDFETNFFLLDINYQNTRAFTGKDTLSLYNKKIGWNNPTPTFSFDISGSLFSTEATTLTSIIKSINNIPGYEDLKFNFDGVVTINASVSVNNNFTTNSLSAINLYVTNFTQLSTRRDIITLGNETDLPSNFTPNFYVQALTGLSAGNLIVNEQAIVRNNINVIQSVSALNFITTNDTVIKTNTRVSTITADGTIYGILNLDPSESNPLEYNENNQLTLKRESDIAFGIKPSDTYSTDDNSFTRNLTSSWDNDHDVPSDIKIQKPYFQSLYGVHDYITSRGLFGNNLTVYLFEDVIAGEATPNKHTSALFQSGKYPRLHRTGSDTLDPTGPGGVMPDDLYATVPVLCANVPGSWSRPSATLGHDNRFYGVQFYTTEWLGSNYPSLTAAGLRGGHYSWFKTDALGNPLSASAVFGPRWVTWSDAPRFRKQTFCGMHNIGPRVSGNPAYNYFTPVKPFDQPSPKFIIRNYICYDPNLRFGDFGTGDPKPWIMVSRGENSNKYSYSRASYFVFSNENRYFFKNLGFELEHNSIDSTPAVWVQGSASYSNILVSNKGRGRNVYGTICREDGFATLPRSKSFWCGEYQIDPDFLRPSRWNNNTKTFTTEWSGIRGAVGPNYYPGFAVAAHGNYTPGTPEYDHFGYNDSLGGVRRDGWLVGDYYRGSAGSFFSKGFENATSSYIFDNATEGREIGKNSQLQSSIILDGFFNLGGDTWDPSMFEVTRTTTQLFAGNLFRTATLSSTYRAISYMKYDQAITLSPNDSHIELANQMLLTYRDDLGDYRNFSFFQLAGMSNYWSYSNYLTPWSLYYINPATPPLQPTPVPQIYNHSIWRRNTSLNDVRSTRFYKLSAEQKKEDITGAIAPDWINLDPLTPYEPVWLDPLSSTSVYYNSVVDSPPIYTLIQDTPDKFRFTINNILSSFDELKRYDEPGLFTLVSPFNRELTSTMVFYVTASR